MQDGIHLNLSNVPCTLQAILGTQAHDLRLHVTCTGQPGQIFHTPQIPKTVVLRSSLRTFDDLQPLLEEFYVQKTVKWISPEVDLSLHII